ERIQACDDPVFALIGFFQFGKLCVEIGQSAIELFAIARVLNGLQLPLNTSSRQNKYFPLTANFHLRLRQLPLMFTVLFGLELLNLPLNGLAFPSSRHA
ncbi:MAG: hypothetical protein WCD43_10135, partial [Candidatus Acidiferrales bacterium]